MYQHMIEPEFSKRLETLRDLIKSSYNINPMWRRGKSRVRPESFVRFVQLYRDKWITFLKVMGVSGYPILDNLEIVLCDVRKNNFLKNGRLFAIYLWVLITKMISGKYPVVLTQKPPYLGQ